MLLVSYLMCGVLVYSIIIIYGKFGFRTLKLISWWIFIRIECIQLFIQRIFNWNHIVQYIKINENASDQAEAKEARQNIAKHVQTELVSETHSSEVTFFLSDSSLYNWFKKIIWLLRVIAKIWNSSKKSLLRIINQACLM